MHIYFRCCEAQKTSNGVKDRWNKFDKTEILKNCWLSVQQSVTTSDKLIILHDNVSENTLNFLDKTSAVTPEWVKVPTHDWNYQLHHLVLADELEKNIQKTDDREGHYLLEDDYLHLPNSIAYLNEAIKLFDRCFLVSYDYPDRYIGDWVRPTKIFLGPRNHWRVIDSTTFTVLATSFVWKQAIGNFRKVAAQGNDTEFSKIYSKIPCLSPILGYSTHLCEDSMTPYINWVDYWKEIENFRKGLEKV